MRFSKWHGLGNDYLLLARADVGVPLEPALVRRLCDRHRDRRRRILEILSVDGARPRS
jgi:diaminopimelate epimerase